MRLCGHTLVGVRCTWPIICVVCSSRQASLATLSRPISQTLRRAMAMALERSGFALARLRLTVAFDPPGPIFVALAPFADMPEEVYQQGTHTVTAHLARNTPLAKATHFIEQRTQARATLPAGIEEVLLLGPDDTILEGSTSNFFAVLHGRLRTAGEGVLVGITRTLVLEIARTVLPVDLQGVILADLPSVAEAFLTSSSRGILPVVTIDERAVGSGVPGPMTTALRQLYLRRVEQDLEPLYVS